MSLPTTAGAQGGTGSNKTSKVGPIVGGVIGGLLVIVAAIAIILWRRRSPPTNESEKDLEVRQGSVQPFINQPGPLPKKSAHGYGVQMESIALGDAGSLPIHSNTASVRAELLRKERDRINREIALLENGSSSGTDSSESSSDPLMASFLSNPVASTLNDQLVSLREQIQQIEARQMYGTSEPPPGYHGSSRNADVEDA